MGKKRRIKELEREVDILRSTVHNLSQTVQRHERDIIETNRKMEEAKLYDAICQKLQG